MGWEGNEKAIICYSIYLKKNKTILFYFYWPPDDVLIM